MPNPSLLIVPARFKTGRLYSQIPSNTDNRGDFNVTRATAATRVNSAGLIESVASGIPRLDYFASGGVVGCPALLVEPAATNLVPIGLTFNSAAGVLYDTTVTGSPAVSINSARITKNEASGTLRYANQNCSTNALAGTTTYTISRFFKYDGVDFATSMEYNSSTQWGVSWNQAINIASTGITLGTSTACTGSVENYGNGWYRVAVRMTTGASPTGSPVTYLMRLPAALSTGQGFLTALPQLETGSVATSYIPTTTAAITRGADVISKTGVSSLIGQTEGTIYAEFSVDFNNRNADILSINAGNSNNGFFMSLRDTSVVQLIVRTLGNNELIFQRVGAFSIGVNKLAMAYKNGDFAICLNGTAVQTNTNNITMPSVSINKIGLGDSALYALDRQLRIRATALLPTRLTNAQLQALTT